MKSALYITFDGLLEPLGTSQIIRPLVQLARDGLAYIVVSLEKPQDLQDTARVRKVENDLEREGIRWVHAPFAVGGGRNAVINLTKLTWLVFREVAKSDVVLLHARAHLSALVARTVQTTTAIPYLFDFRGYWFDEQKERGAWVTRPTAYRLAKALEALLVRNAAAVVCLTDLATFDVRSGTFGPTTAPAVTIPTLADYDEFRRDGRSDLVPGWARDRLQGRLVVAYIGSINASYAVDASMKLFQRIRARRADAHLLCLTRQDGELRELIGRHNIDAADVTIADALHSELAPWLRHVDWGLLLLHEPFAKRGSMPTKLGEWLACGVRPIQHGCNSEVSQWVRRAGSGIVVDSLSDADLDRAADHIAAHAGDEGELTRARKISEPHFGLQIGVERYADLIRPFFPPSSSHTKMENHTPQNLRSA